MTPPEIINPPKVQSSPISFFPNAWWLQGQKITRFLKNGQIYLCKYVNLGEGKRSVNTILGPEMDEEGHCRETMGSGGDAEKGCVCVCPRKRNC
jgi:hypothetical protein